MAPVLQDKVALVTGAGGQHGIGRSSALRLAGEGADVMLSDVHERPRSLYDTTSDATSQWRGLDGVKEEVEGLGRRAAWRTCDLTDEDQTRSLVDDTVERFGRVDILVNNARAMLDTDLTPVAQLDAHDWDRVMSVNLRGTFLLSKHVLVHMLANEVSGGRIINISSNSGRQGEAGMAAYCTSKFGVMGLTQSMAMEVAAKGITVNAVCPGPINTDRFSPHELRQAEEQGLTYQEFRERQVRERSARHPMQRIGTADEVASAVAYLASPDAGFITGQGLDVNGGIWMG